MEVLQINSCTIVSFIQLFHCFIGIWCPFEKVSREPQFEMHILPGFKNTKPNISFFFLAKATVPMQTMWA
jgi:hypothetical protein